MMGILIVLIGCGFVFFALDFLLDDGEVGAFLIAGAMGAVLIGGGMHYRQTVEQLHDSEQYVLSLKEGPKAELSLMAKKLEASQEAAMELSIENHALQNQQTECVEKQQVSQDTLSGIKEILEN